MNNIVDRIYLDILKFSRELGENKKHEILIFITPKGLLKIRDIKYNYLCWEEESSEIKYFLFGLNLFTFNNGYNDNEYQITVRLL